MVGQEMSFIEKARYYADKIEKDIQIRKELREKRYREWLKNPVNKKGKKRNLPSMKDLKKQRNRFWAITCILWAENSIHAIFFLHSMTVNPVSNVIFLCCNLIGAAHVLLGAGVDFAIYRRWGVEESFLPWDANYPK